MQRRGAEVVGGVRARAGADQQIGDGEVVAMRRPMKRRRAVALRRIHVDALLQQRAHRFDVAVLHRLDQPRISRLQSLAAGPSASGRLPTQGAVRPPVRLPGSRPSP